MIIISIGEIFLKGKNKPFFIRMLIKNIHAALPGATVKFTHHKLLCPNIVDFAALSRVFGITHYVSTDLVPFEKIGEKALSLITSEKTFCIRSRRIFKVYKTSQEINEEIGGFILDHQPGIKVQLTKPEAEIFIEIFDTGAYVYKTVYPGLGGLPVGTSGDIYLEVTNEKMATVTGFLMMKRGCSLVVSKALPLLDNFSAGCPVYVRAKRDSDILVSDQTSFSLSSAEKHRTVLRPLDGFSTKKIEEMYQKIIQL